jgi:hypothetical protein
MIKNNIVYDNRICFSEMLYANTFVDNINKVKQEKRLMTVVDRMICANITPESKDSSGLRILEIVNDPVVGREYNSLSIVDQAITATFHKGAFDQLGQPETLFNGGSELNSIQDIDFSNERQVVKRFYKSFLETQCWIPP